MTQDLICALNKMQASANTLSDTLYIDIYVTFVASKFNLFD